MICGYKYMKNSISKTVIISSAFGLLAGVSGFLAANYYLNQSIVQLPYIGQLDLSQFRANRSLVINSAGKIVVEQSDKLASVIDSGQSSLVGIYKKPSAVPAGEEQYLSKDEAIAEGVALTNDGWLLINGLPENLTDSGLKNYIVATQDKKIYTLDKIIASAEKGFFYVHAVGARDLNINKFIEDPRFLAGNDLVALNWQGRNYITTLTETFKRLGQVESSDNYQGQLEPVDLKADFSGGPIFGISGELVGLVSGADKIFSAENIQLEIASILKNQEIVHSVLGVNYISLADLIPVSGKVANGALIAKNANGVAVVKKSPADLAGLKENDIIISLDSVAVNKNNPLNFLLKDYNPGDQVKIKYSRDGQEQEVLVTLGKAVD